MGFMYFAANNELTSFLEPYMLNLEKIIVGKQLL